MDITGVGWVNTAGAGQGRQARFTAGGDGPMPKLSRKDIFSGPFPRFGRMDGYSRLGVSAISFALRDAGLAEWTGLREIAIIASTVYGCLNADEAYYDTVMPEGGRLASPNHFVYTLTNTYLGEAAIQFGLTGPGFVLCEPALSGVRSLEIAMGGIGRGEYDAAIAGVCDAGAPASLAMTGRSVPGALFFVLQKAPGAHDRSYGVLTQEGPGAIFFGRKQIEDLNDLARICTRGLAQEKETAKDI